MKPRNMLLETRLEQIWLSLGRVESGQCFSSRMTTVFRLMAAVDGLICVFALVQLIRLQLHLPRSGWTRQKVFHMMLFVANLGYTLYFLVSPWASCAGWPCWSHECGFILLAVPQIVFLATFLLLLSFWVDLCYQATDRLEEEEEVEEEPPSELDGEAIDTPPKLLREKRRGCICWRKLRVRGRQKVVIGVVLFICILTGAFALLIWIGMGNNPINSQEMAEVYAEFFACINFLAGGGLAFYGLLLYTKLYHLRSGKSAKDIGKVAWLAIICLICFTIKIVLVLARNVAVIGITNDGGSNRLSPMVTLLYYLIGESLPSAVVLFILNDMPQRSRDSSVAGGDNYTASIPSLDEDVLQQALIPQWVVPPDGTPYPLVPSIASSPQEPQFAGSIS